MSRRNTCSAIAALLLCGASLAVTAQPASGDIVFPALERSYLKTGDFVGPHHVRRITPGLNKDQVRLELGNPHFSEGIFAVREWDYAFNFYTGRGREFVTCQFKVKYDDAADGTYRVTSTHWKDPACDGYLNSVAAPA